MLKDICLDLCVILWYLLLRKVRLIRDTLIKSIHAPLKILSSRCGIDGKALKRRIPSNMNAIQDLYYGRISPYEMSISATPEYQKLKALADRNEGMLRETLSDEQKKLLEKLTVCMTDISSISERDMFIAGFRLGMKMMMDVMKDE